MKKILLYLITLFAILLLFSCGECDHDWRAATCQSPQACSICGETRGEKTPHSFGEWTETKASSCYEKGSETRSCACGEVEKQDIPLTEHSYDHACDTACNTEGCNATREALHVFSHACDTSCNTVGCGATRQINHVYDNDCDGTCNTAGCGVTRQTQHVYDNDCDDTCNTVGCGVTRQTQHVFTNDCDTSCNVSGCDHTREVPHVFSNVCDTSCNTSGCGHTRQVPHVYSHACDTTCNTVGCNKTRQIQHVYDHACDPTCNTVGCSTTRQIQHVNDPSVQPAITLPTCEYPGYTTHKCLNCKQEYVTDHVDAHGHAYGDWYVYSPITSTSNGGTKRADCINCMKHKEEPIGVISAGYFGGIQKTQTLTETATYKVYEDGTLKIEGEGVTFDPNWKGENQPYINYRSFIKRAIVGEGITYIQGGVFAYMPNLEEYEIASTVYYLTGNTFMESFKLGITEFTVPASIEHLGICIVGPYSKKDSGTALFTDIYIENPNVTFHKETPNKGDGSLYISFNSYLNYYPDLTIYSYGSSNNVKTYCDTYGIRYVDLNSIVYGVVDNLKYSSLEGNMILSAVDQSKPVSLPNTQPWLDKLSRSDIKTIDITANITDIPASYFKDYTSLTTLNLPSTLQTIGAEAFATTNANSTPLTIKTYDALVSVANDFLKNRTGVTINGIYGTALDNFTQNGVTINLKKSIKILLIGNSLSQDAADYTSPNKPSQLYNIIKSMVGDDCYVKIATLCAGAKTAGWHATMAETNAPQYLFTVISDDTNGLWTSTSDVTSIQGLTSDKWDYITIQPYGTEARKGTGSTADSDTKPENAPVKAEKFYSLSASLPYLLDHIDTYCPDAKIYYYMTWSNYYNKDWDDASDLALNGAEAEFVNERLPVARTAMTYKGTNSGRGFDGLIAGGTAIQNARSTYLGTQFYTTYNKPPAKNKPDTTSWIGLQRDDVHLSLSTGRYIVALSFAEILVPKEYRLTSYTLPEIADTVKGPLPSSHTLLAQLCVQKMLETSLLTGDEQFKVTKLTGYEQEPS